MTAQLIISFAIKKAQQDAKLSPQTNEPKAALAPNKQSVHLRERDLLKSCFEGFKSQGAKAQKLLKAVIFYDNGNKALDNIDELIDLINLTHSYDCAAFCQVKLYEKLPANWQSCLAKLIDGWHIEDKDALVNFTPALHGQKAAKTSFSAKQRGFGPIHSKHQAMEIGESAIDYLFFGKLGYDKNQQYFAKNYQLAKWWCEIMQIPAILQLPADLTLIEQGLNSPIDFIALDDFFWQAKDIKSNIATLIQLIK